MKQPNEQNTSTRTTDNSLDPTDSISTRPVADNSSGPLPHVEEIMIHNTSDSISESPLSAIVDRADAVASEDQGKEAFQLWDLAHSALVECNEAAPLFNLNAAMVTLRDALKRRFTPHAFRSESIVQPVTVLVTRLSLTDQHQDPDQIIVLCGEILREWWDTLADVGRQPQMGTCAEHDKMSAADSGKLELSQLSVLPKSSLTNFNQSTQLSSLDNAVTMHQKVLLLCHYPHPKWAASVGSLTAALYARFRHRGDMTNLDEAISVLRRALEICPKSHECRTKLTASLSVILATRFNKTGGLPDLLETITRYCDTPNVVNTNDHTEANQLLGMAAYAYQHFQKSTQLTHLETSISLCHEGLALQSVHHPARSNSLNNLAIALDVRFNQSGQPKDLDEAISLRQDALKLLPTPRHPSISFDLATHLQMRFERSGVLEDLDKAILLYRTSLELLPPQDPNRFRCLCNLGYALNTRFDQFGRRNELDEAILLLQEVLELHPVPNGGRHAALNNLAKALNTRFQHFDQLHDLEKATSLHRDALGLLSAAHPQRFITLINLSSTLGTRFEQSGLREDLEEAISLCRDALKLKSPPHQPLLSMCLCQLANALWTRFNRFGLYEDLDESISLHRDALELRPARHPHRSDSLSNLATALSTRFDQSGQRIDLDEAISLHQEALGLQPAPHPKRSTSLVSLGNALKTRFQQSGLQDDLNQAIFLYRAAVELRPARPARCLDSLASALLKRFQQSGLHDDLDEAIALHRNAVKLCPAPHPLRFNSINHLAIALYTRFDQSRQRKDLNEAISLHRDSLKLLDISSPNRSIALSNLANVLRLRSEELGIPEDLDEAISLHRDALKLRAAPHSLQSTSLIGLGCALWSRFCQVGLLKDLDDAISLHKAALELQTAAHPDRFLALDNLAVAIQTRFDHSGLRTDLDEAIATFHECVDTLPNGHPKSCSYSANLATALIKAYTNTNESKYLDRAMNAYRVAVNCESASASERLRAAKLWAGHADSIHESALEAYQAAIELLPRIATLGLDLQSRLQAMTSGTHGLARASAACAIRSGQYDKAVELLEQGRAIFWSQALQLRTPMNDLRGEAPELEQKLRRISLALERGSHRDVSEDISDIPVAQKVVSMEEEASHFRRLSDEWLTTLEEVRQLDDFRRFLLPNELSKLQSATANGPVAILNVAKTGCAALILSVAGVQHVPLPEMSLYRANLLIKLIQIATSPNGRDTSLSESDCERVDGLVRQMPPLSDTKLISLRKMGRAGQMRPDDVFSFILAKLWETVVEPVICSLNLPKSDIPPHLWWCPTGPLAFLPIHAAGVYSIERMESVSDYVVSSYTPTISALLRDIPLHTNSFKMMAVIQPETPGQKSLPYTINELQKIRGHVSNENLVSLTPGFVDEVISRLPSVSIVHFACHGQQNPQNPLESALVLQDGKLKVADIMQQSMPHESLAFLSACETAMGDENLPDEVIHLGSALLFAGFHGVVATMWSISDADGPKIVDSFYDKLFKESSPTTINISTPDTTQAARALHHAVTKLRSEKVSFARWVPFIHLGR